MTEQIRIALARIEEKLDRVSDDLRGTGPHDPGLIQRVNLLEHQVISKKAVLTAAIVIAAVAGATASLLSALVKLS